MTAPGFMRRGSDSSFAKKREELRMRGERLSRDNLYFHMQTCGKCQLLKYSVAKIHFILNNDDDNSTEKLFGW